MNRRMMDDDILHTCRKPHTILKFTTLTSFAVHSLINYISQTLLITITHVGFVVYKVKDSSNINGKTQKTQGSANSFEN